MIAIIAFTRQGCELGQQLAEKLKGKLWTPERFAGKFDAVPYVSLSSWTAERFRAGSGMIFVSATGIAVRAIAPYVGNKFTDPPVVSVDELGRFAVPLLSGHVGGANALACQVAVITGGQAVISTATDVNGLFAVDVWAKENQLHLVERDLAKQVSAALLQGKRVGFVSDLPYGGTLPQELTGETCELGIYVGPDAQVNPFAKTLHLLPKDVIVGVGCKRNTPCEALERRILNVLKEQGICPERVYQLATIDMKAHEPGLIQLCQSHHWSLQCFSAEELAQAPGEFTPSAFVASVTGVDNVCERAAACAGGKQITKKNAEDGVTVALAQRPIHITV